MRLYKKTMYFFAIILFFFFTFVYYIYFDNILNAFIVGIVSCVFVILSFYYYPYSLRGHYVGLIEKDLPFFLLELDIKLSIGMNFVSALESMTKEQNILAHIFRQSLNQYDKGIPFNKSFLNHAGFYESQDLSRALNQIYAIYQSGYKSESRAPLFSLAEELLDKQKAEAKVFHSKLVMISLLFIGATALLPSLFLVFISIGGAIMDVGISAFELIFIFVVLFPLIDIVIIFVIYAMTPWFMKS